MHDNSTQKITPMGGLKTVKQTVGVVLTQYSLQARLHKFKENGKEMIHQELKQLHDMDVFIPIPKRGLTVKQQRKAFSTVILI